MSGFGALPVLPALHGIRAPGKDSNAKEVSNYGQACGCDAAAFCAFPTLRTSFSLAQAPEYSFVTALSALVKANRSSDLVDSWRAGTDARDWRGVKVSDDGRLIELCVQEHSKE